MGPFVVGSITLYELLGSDENIMAVFSSLVTITRNGTVQANTPPTHNDEVKH